MKSRGLGEKILRSVLFALLIAAIVLPVLTLALWAFALRWPWPDLLPVWGSRGVAEVLTSADAAAMLRGTAISLAVALLAVALSLPGARVLAFYEFRGKGIVEGALLLPLFTPTISVALGLQFVFLKAGLANTLQGVILVQVVPCIPYVVTLLRNGFEAFGRVYEEQAFALGASRREVWLDISLPLLRPYIAAALWMAFLVSSGQYLLTFVIGGGLVETPTTQLFAYAQNGERPAAAVLSLFFLAVCLGVSLMLGRILKTRYTSRTAEE